MSQAPALQDRIEPVSFDLFSKDFSAFTQALGDSYARWGFAVISDHGGPIAPMPFVGLRRKSYGTA